MNKFISAFMAAMGMACYCSMPANAQDLAALGKPVSPFERSQTKSLKSVLDGLEVKYNVHFMYKSNLATLQLSRIENNRTSSLEEELKSITTANKLRYKKMGEGFYIVYLQDDEPAAAPPPTGSRENTPSPVQSAMNMPPLAAPAAIPVKGVVTDENGQPIPGVTVLVKGTTNGTSTGVDGSWSLQVPNENAVLEFSFIGYTKQEVAVAGRTTITIKLTQDVTAISEVVVVAYGTQKKVNVTGAISAIDGKDVSWKPVGQVSAALQGMAPGVTVTTGSGQPGADQGTIRIRGVGTLNSTDPLVLVDGVQMNMNDVDMNDIASYSVLKDAASSAIYGVRAANGVILITTKRGASGKAKVSYSNYFAWQRPARLAKYVGAKDFMKLVNQTATNSGANPTYTDAQIAAYDDPNRNKDQYPDNYWLDDVLTGSGFQQEHSLGISGGTEDIKYRFSTNYFDQKGLISNMDFNRLTVRLNTDINVTKKLTFSADIAARLGDRQEPQGASGSAWYQFGQAAVVNPLSVNKYSDGTWALVRGGQNPIRLQEEGGLYQYKSNLFTGNFKATYNLLKGLKLTGLTSVNYRSDYNSMHEKALTYFTDFPTNENTLTLGQNTIRKAYQGYWFRNYQGLAEYTHSFGKHSFTLLAGASRLSETTDDLSGYRVNLPNGTIEQIDAGAATGQIATGNGVAYSLVSFFGRLNYSYNDKYLFEANLRRDGSSRFSDGQKWGLFPSFSAGWRISSEEFMRDLTFINNMKIRGSWGKLGNDVILDRDKQSTNYPYQSVYYYNSYPFGGVLNPTAGIQIYPNSGLTWETTVMTDVGVDATLFKNLDFTFDYYKKNTKDILLFLPINPSVGLDPSAQNAGKVQNTGWEVSLNYRGKIGQVDYHVGGNLSDVRNKIIDIKNTDAITRDNNFIYTGLITGQPIGGFYGYQVEGIFQNAAQVAAHATQPFPTTGPGDLIYKDQNNDKQVKEGAVSKGGDMVYLGSNIPRYTYGFNLGADYKHFDLSAFFQGVGKVSIHTLPIERAPTSNDGNFREEHLNSWTSTNTSADFPRLVNTTQNYQSSSYWVKSGAYLRLKSVQLGYTLPDHIMKRAGFDRCRIYVSGQNLLTFSSLPNDIDPEAPNDSRYYPQVRTINFGLNVQF
ncbi:SusC/RagA family TonB-linked outer membrane protein [Chitinophaga filiformis]|uniref:SusC/RagA family TonB-linked outer membrane protein n=1 Tax=Chitinophaga filiformis TaxID=104663 RepID=UPI001F245C9B|nr:SusC/RagA family TonB-linked outer membrane protein [Chitinophaga filiformis]MCF6402679.1 SusC/RagA family TonB-linked outer membrane protein [Chitinophaga filiformis]MCF6403403.1 SusC/RagA family TonB-linked outer membrane protein [Chitinophaga filiformis]